MTNGPELILQASCVAIDGQALVIEGPVGSGKSSLALTLIDRGAQLIGDDGVTLRRKGETIYASPPPNIAGLIELRGIGLVEMETGAPAPLGLILKLGAQNPATPGERLPEQPKTHDILGLAVPWLDFIPGAIAPAQRAEWALRTHGLHSRR